MFQHANEQRKIDRNFPLNHETQDQQGTRSVENQKTYNFLDHKKNRVSHLKQEIQKSEVKIFKVLNLRLCKPQIREIMSIPSRCSLPKFIIGMQIIIMMNRLTS